MEPQKWNKLTYTKFSYPKKAERQDFIRHGLTLACHDSEISATPHSKLTDIFGLDPFYMDVQIENLDKFLLNLTFLDPNIQDSQGEEMCS